MDIAETTSLHEQAFYQLFNSVTAHEVRKLEPDNLIRKEEERL